MIYIVLLLLVYALGVWINYRGQQVHWTSPFRCEGAWHRLPRKKLGLLDHIFNFVSPFLFGGLLWLLTLFQKKPAKGERVYASIEE